MMNRKPLGNTGIDVSEVSFGCVEIGLPYGLGVKDHSDVPPEDEAIQLLRTAVDHGINFFDTARLYGRSEDILGKAFANRRQDVVLATKCSHFTTPLNTLSADAIRRQVRESLETSLRTLQTDHVDLYMLHTGTIDVVSHPAVIAAFDECKQQGLTRAVGASTYTPEETQKTIEMDFWNVIQLPYHLIDQRQGEFFQQAKEKGIGIVVRSVLFRGLLTDRAKTLHPELKRLQDHREKYNPVLEEAGISLAELAMSFVLSQPEVSSVLVGIDRMEYLRTAVGRASRPYLGDDILARLKALAFPEPEWINLPAWDRKGWLT